MSKSKPFFSGLLGGVTAAVIWMAITIALNMSPTTIGVGGLLFLVFTTVVAAVITHLVARGRSAA